MHGFPAHRIRLLFLLLVTVIVAGCISDPRVTACDGTNFNEVTLQPGCSTLCAEEPCKLYFRMPAGDGAYMVREGAVEIGRFPAGRTVFLGTFWQGWHEFTVEGSDSPPARVRIPGSR